jgi:hypothetical protein
MYKTYSNSASAHHSVPFQWHPNTSLLSLLCLGKFFYQPMASKSMTLVCHIEGPGSPFRGFPGAHSGRAYDSNLLATVVEEWFLLQSC